MLNPETVSKAVCVCVCVHIFLWTGAMASTRFSKGYVTPKRLITACKRLIYGLLGGVRDMGGRGFETKGWAALGRAQQQSLKPQQWEPGGVFVVAPPPREVLDVGGRGRKLQAGEQC